MIVTPGFDAVKRLSMDLGVKFRGSILEKMFNFGREISEVLLLLKPENLSKTKKSMRKDCKIKRNVI